jgi:glutathione-regulated potassium-efflux system protein KefB
MAMELHDNDLIRVVALLAAGVISVPLFRRLGLGSVLGYLAAGLVIGPFGLGLFTDPQAILHVAEIGVVLFLFLIGLETQPSRLWALRRQIFGLGAAQVAACGLLLTLTCMAAGLSATAAFFAAMGFTLSSTAIVVQILEERGDVATPRGQRIVSILLLEDLAIVPLLALVAFLTPGEGDAVRWQEIALGLAALAALVVAGRYLLSPLFRLLANSKAREVMTAAALLVVLGAALLMQLGGLSMAMGAFLAGVLLSESTFRHQLEADIEPFRGILLGLFFIGVGMSLDLSVFAHEWLLILAGALMLKLVKGAGAYAVARAICAKHPESLYRAILLSHGGEFGFVLYAAAAAAAIFDARLAALLTAIIIVSMAITPFGVLALRWLMPREEQSMEGVEAANGLGGSVLVIGFGRFGQVVSQSLLARGFDIAIIDTDTEMIRSAADFGFKIYYGDGTRLDVLKASGAERARAIAVCIDNREAADRIVALARSEFPHAKLLVRAFDRAHSLKLVGAGVDYQVRETFQSAMAFGEAALLQLGVPEAEAAQVAEEVRRRDNERFEAEIAGGLAAGAALIRGNLPKPTPFTTPRQAPQPLSAETAAVAASQGASTAS